MKRQEFQRQTHILTRRTIQWYEHPKLPIFLPFLCFLVAKEMDGVEKSYVFQLSGTAKTRT